MARRIKIATGLHKNQSSGVSRKTRQARKESPFSARLSAKVNANQLKALQRVPSPPVLWIQSSIVVKIVLCSILMTILRRIVRGLQKDQRIAVA